MNKRYNEVAKKYGDKMREARLKRGLSQAQAAKKIGISKSHYCHLEQGYVDFRSTYPVIRSAVERVLHLSQEEINGIQESD